VQAVLAAANSMAVVFAILFLLDQGGFGVPDVVLFNLLSFGAATIVCVAMTRVRPGRARAQMAAGLTVLAVAYGSYLVLRGWPLLLFVAVAWGAYIPLFFLPFNALVIGITGPEDRAGKIGSFILTYTAVGIAGPYVGGILVDRLGYDALFAIAAGILAVDLGFVLRLREGRRRIRFRFAFRAVGVRTSAALLAEGGFEGIAFGVVPILAYGFTQKAVDLGGLFSLFALAGGVMTVALGVWSDRLRNRRPFLLAGAACSTLASLLVVGARSLGEFAAGQSLLALTASLAPLFLFTIAIERVPGRPASVIATRELLLNAGRTASLAACFVLVSFGLTAQHAFLLAAVSLAFVALGDPRGLRPAEVAQGIPGDNGTAREKGRKGR